MAVLTNLDALLSISCSFQALSIVATPYRILLRISDMCLSDRHTRARPDLRALCARQTIHHPPHALSEHMWRVHSQFNCCWSFLSSGDVFERAHINNNHPIGKLPNITTSHYSCQSPICSCWSSCWVLTSQPCTKWLSDSSHKRNVSRETPRVMTELLCYDLTNILAVVGRAAGFSRRSLAQA